MQRAQQAHMEQAHEAAEQAAVIAPKADEAIPIDLEKEKEGKRKKLLVSKIM